MFYVIRVAANTAAQVRLQIILLVAGIFLPVKSLSPKLYHWYESWFKLHALSCRSLMNYQYLSAHVLYTYGRIYTQALFKLLSPSQTIV